MKKTILATYFDTKKLHPYTVRTKGKHPVHMIEGGKYLTEEQGDFGSGDMYWFNLNQVEYEYFKNNLKQVEIEID